MSCIELITYEQSVTVATERLSEKSRQTENQGINETGEFAGASWSTQGMAMLDGWKRHLSCTELAMADDYVMKRRKKRAENKVIIINK